FGKMELDWEVNEQNDWIDVMALVHFGEYKIPFIELRHHILNHIREFVLPSGEIALIPEQCFAQFSSLFQFSSKRISIALKKHHLGLLQELEESEMLGLSMKRNMPKLSSVAWMEQIAVPTDFKGSLSPYQKVGYDWFQF